jgi:hypothetical protein
MNMAINPGKTDMDAELMSKCDNEHCLVNYYCSVLGNS